MDPRNALWILLLIGTVYAQQPLQCEVVEQDEGMMTIIMNTVYREDGIHPFQSVSTDAETSKDVETDEMIVVDNGGNAHDVEVGDESAPVERTLLNGLYIEGPFVVTYKIDDTLRIARKGYTNYGEGSLLRERFEGRLEYSIEELGTFLDEIIAQINNSRPPIKNVISAEEFKGSIVCASSSCTKELYSLLTKYMNIGASSEMVMELGGMKLVLGPVRRALEGARSVISQGTIKVERTYVEELLKNVNRLHKLQFEKAIEMLKKLSPAEKEAIKNLLKEPNKALEYTQNLTIHGKASAYAILSKLKKDLPEIEDIRKLTNEALTNDDEVYFNNLKSMVEDVSKKLDELEKEMDKVSKELDGVLDEELKKVKELKKEFDNLKKRLEDVNWDHFLSESIQTLIEQKGEIYNELRMLMRRYETAATTLGREVPAGVTQADLIQDSLRGMVGGEGGITGRRFVSDYIATPLAFYILRTQVLPPTVDGTSLASGLSKVMPVKRSYKLPDAWTTFNFEPAEMDGVFMDILVGNGSDPGNVFKTYLSILPIGWLDALLTETMGGNPLDIINAIPDKYSRDLYEMEEAIVVFATPDKCVTCSITDGKSMKGSFSLALTENKKETTGIITFFRRTSLITDEGKVIDPTDSENACINQCSLLTNSIFSKNPAVFTFLHSAVIGLLVPNFAGLTATVLLGGVSTLLFTGGCTTCVDTTFGYYLHVLALKPPEETEDPLQKVAEQVSNLGLGETVNQWLDEYKKSMVEKERAMFYADIQNADVLIEGRVINVWFRAERSMPTEFKETALSLETEDGERVDIGNGVVTDGERSAQSVGADLSIIDQDIPGIIIPTNLRKASVDSIVLEATSSKDFTIGGALKECITVNPGYLKVIEAEKGTVELKEDSIYVKGEAWTGEASKVVINNGEVFVEVKDITPDGVEQRTVSLGRLLSIVFDNTSIVRRGVDVYVWNREEGVPQESVEDVDVETDGEKVNLDITPSPDATREEAETVEEMSQNLEDVKVIDGSTKTVVISENEEGEKFLTIYDKETGEVTREKILNMSSEDGTLVITTEDSDGNINEHRITIDVKPDGTPILSVDGESGGVVKTVQTPQGFLMYNPETGEWKFVSGVLAPLAEAFKEGMKIAFEGGKGTATPSGNIIVTTPQAQTPMALPTLEEWFLLLVALSIGLMLVLLRGR